MIKMTARWVVALGAALGLALLTLPVVPNFSIEPLALFFAEDELEVVSACDDDAKPAPLDFTLKDMNGNEVSLASLRGSVILLNFWATWCGPCKIEIPWFVEFQRQNEDDGLVVLGLSVDDTPGQIKLFAAQFQVNYTMLVGLGREDVQEAFGPIWGIPVTFFIDREGTLCRTHMGLTTREDFEKDLRALL